jgi:hypothetical protein
MTYNTGVAGDRSVSVSGEVHGEVKQTLVIEASKYFSALIDKVERIVLAGTVGSNGPGSAGLSSPDAKAASAGLAGP